MVRPNDMTPARVAEPVAVTRCDRRRLPHAPKRMQRGTRMSSAPRGRCQLKLSPQAQEPVAFGLSMVKPCFSMVSTKSIEAPST